MEPADSSVENGKATPDSGTALESSAQALATAPTPAPTRAPAYAPTRVDDVIAVQPEPVAPQPLSLETPQTVITPQVISQPQPVTGVPQPQSLEVVSDEPLSLESASEESGAQELPTATTVTSESLGSSSLTPNDKKQSKTLSLLRFNRQAFLITGGVMVLLALIITGVLTLSRLNANHQANSVAGKTGNYAVGKLPLGNVRLTDELQIGNASQLAVNGLLRLNNTLVLSPTNTPSSPSAGQFYFDRTTNTPYFYNGTQFVSLAPQHITSLGGASGVLGLSGSFSVVNNQLSLSDAVLQQITAGSNAPRVASLQGLTGDVTLGAGPGILINGTNISNSGVLNVVAGSNITVTNDGNGNYTVNATGGGGSGVSSLTGTPNQVNVSASTGNITLSLPQDIGVTSTPTFGGLTLGNTLTVANGGTGVANFPTNGILYGNGTGPLLTAASANNSVLVTDGTGTPSLSQTLPLQVQANITQTGVLNAGAITAGFGAISTVNNITTTALIQGGSLEITGGNFTVDAAGNITTTGTTQVQGAGGLTLGVAGNTTGNLVFANNSNNHFVTLQGLAPAGQDQTIVIPASIAATDTVCLLTLGNCFGSGSSVTSIGTQNYIPKFTNAAANEIGDSLLFDNGTSIGVGTNTPGASYLLDVNGNLNVVGSSTVGNGLTVTAGGATITGNISQVGGGSFTTGTGAVTLNGNTSVTGTNTLTVGTGATTLGGTLGVTGLATLSGGATILTSATITGATNINTSGTANTSIGNATGTFGLASSGLNVSTAGTLSGITGYTQSSGNFSQSGSGTFSTGTGAVSLNGATTIASTLAIQGANSLTLGTAGPAGNTGAIVFNNSTNGNTLTLQAGATAGNLTFTLPTADGGNGNCLMTDGSGNLSFQSCTGGAGGGVTSLDGLTGVLTISNSSGAGGTITIDDAQANGTTKGIATFNATNFTDNGSGVINTIQGIATTSAPTFAGLTLSSALTVPNGGTGVATLALNGILYGNGTSPIQATSAAANSVLITDGSNVPSLSQTLPTAVQGNITSVGVLGAGSIDTGFGTINNADTITGTTLNGTTGINTGAGAGTQRIDSSGNLVNIGTITSGLINGQTISSSANFTGTLAVAGTTTLTGDLVANGNVTIGNASTDRLTVAAQLLGATPLVFQGATDNGFATSFAFTDPTANNTVTFRDASGTVCYEGSSDCGFALSGSGVTSLDGLTGVLTISNSSGAGGTITIDDAQANGTTKGIATFNATNFTDNGSGVINTIQGIATTSAPTFAGLTLSSALTVPNGGTGVATLALNGILYGNGTSPIQATSAAANSVLITDGSNVPSLSQTLPTAVQGNITSVGVLGAGSIDTGFGTINNADTITGTTLNGTTGINTGAGAGTQRIDSSGNLVNIGTITSGLINGQTISSSANFTGTLAVAGTTTLTGDLVANGNVTIGNASTDRLTVAAQLLGATPLVFQGATDNGFATSFAFTDPTANNTVTFRDASGTVCYEGSSDCGFALSGSGVTSLDGLTGVLTISNSSGAGGTITIDDAQANGTTKGIATFNATNFTDNGSGVINTIQGIATTSAPTFAGLTLSSALTVPNGGTGVATLALNGILYGNGTSPIQATSAAANSVLITDGSNVPSLSQTLPTAVQGNITSVGVLGAGSIDTGFGTINNADTITGTTLNGTTGINTGAGAGTQRIDSSGNLVNIGTITSGLINGQTISSSANFTGTLAVAGTTTLTGDLVANGNVTIGNASTDRLTVAAQLLGATPLVFQGATDNGFATSFAFTDPTANNTVTFRDASGTVCYEGSSDCGFALSGSGVTSLDGLTGVLTISNSSGAGGTITIDDAQANGTTKGIATFNATNFTDNGSGVINTIQGIATTSAPTFAGLTLSSALTVPNGGTGVATLALNGILYGNGTSPIQATSAAANSVLITDGSNVPSLSQTLPTAVQGNITSVGVLGAGSIDTGFGTINNADTITGTTLNGTTGINTGAGAGTQRIDSSGNLVNIGTITSGLINGQTISSSANFTGSLTVQGSSGLTIGVAGPGGTAGVISLANATNANLSVIQAAVPTGTGTATYTLPVIAGGTSDEICTVNSGNCAGSGTGVTGSGTIGTIALFTGTGAIGNSTLTQSGSTLTASGNMVIQGANSLTLGTAGPAGNTGAIVFNNSTNGNTLTLQAGATAGNLTFTLPTADGGNGNCLMTDGSGNLSFQSCTGGAGGGVTSLDGLTGVLTISNSSGAGGTITIDDAQANGTTKGIATFNATNFTDNGSGVINTIQGIATTSAPTFAGLTLSSALTVPNGGTGVATLALNGILYGNGTSPIQATSAAANSVLITDGSNVPSLSQTLPTAVQGNITSVGVLGAGSIDTGFGTINTGSSITTTATVQGGTVNATSALQLNGTDINTAGTLTNVAYLNQSQTFTGTNTFSATGGNSLAITGIPTNNSALSLIRIGNAIVGGNASTNGGTYIGLNAPASGPGSVADLINLQAGNTSQFRVTSGGTTTIAGAVTASTFSSTGAGATPSFRAVKPSGNAVLQNFLLSADANPSFQINGSGQLNWGAGGASATDTNLYRSTTDTLATDDSFSVGSNLAVAGTTTLTGDLVANGNVTIGNASTDRLTVAAQLLGATPLVFQGATDNGFATSFAFTDPTANNTVTFRDASGTVCYEGSSDCGFALSGSGVTSLDGLTGVLTISNSSGAGGTITIDDAQANGTTKGIATFNATNFTDNGSGVINTIQGIATTSAPTFAGLTLSSALTVPNGGTGVATLALNGILYGNGTSPIQATSAAANSVLITDGSNVPSLSQTLPTAVQGNITSVGVLGAGSIDTGFGTINNADTITGTTLNGTTGINTGAGAGTQRIDSSGNLVNIGTITSGLINGQTISSSANFTGTLAVAGTTTLTGDLVANGNVTIGNASTDRLTVAAQLLGATPLVFQGATDNGFATSFAFTDPTANNTVTFRDASGTVCYEGSSDCGFAAASPSGAYIQKNAQDTSSASTTGNLLGLTNTNTGAAGVLSLTNSGTNSTLTVTSNANPTSGQALIFASNTNVSPTGNLLDLQSGASPTSQFSVSASGAVTAAGLITGNAGANVLGATINLNASSDNATNINTGTSTGTVTLGNAAAGTITVQSGSSVNLIGTTAISIQSPGTINVGTDGSANTIQVGNTTGAVTQTINVGNNGTASSNTTVTVGSIIGTSLTTIQAGTSGVLVKPANSVTAFQIQNSSGSPLLIADSVANTLQTADLLPNVAGSLTQHSNNSAVVAGGGAVVVVQKLGSDGYARMAYTDGNGALKYARCTDADCIGSVVMAIDNDTWTSNSISLAIGSDTYARISYYDSAHAALKYARCTDADCTSPVITIVDSDIYSGNIGEVSLAIGSDGFGRISYYDENAASLKYARCTDADCTSPVVTTVSSGLTSGSISLAIGSDTYARISYGDNDDGSLKYVRCTDADCTSPVTTTVDALGPNGYGTSLAIGSDTYARISYYDNSDQILKYARCTDADCTSPVIATVDSGPNDVGAYSSLELGSDGYARISYIDWNDPSLKYARCTDADCTSPVIATVDTANRMPTSLALGSDGYARIAYISDNNSLKYARCTDANCTSPAVNNLANTVQSGKFSSQKLGSDGYARISYAGINQGLYYARCTDANCTTPVIVTVDDTAVVDDQTSLDIGSDGYARISYHDSNDNSLKYARCTDADCTSPVVTTIGGDGYNSSLIVGSDGYARILYFDNDDGSLKYARCTDADCTSPVVTTISADGDYSSMALGSDGYARISYHDYVSDLLYYARCTDADCTSPVVELLSSSAQGRSTLALGSNGFAKIFYVQNTGLEFISCQDDNCGSRSGGTFSVDNIDYPSLVLKPDGSGGLSYMNYTYNTLQYASCTDNACGTSVSAISFAGSTTDGMTSLAIDSGGAGRISYYDDSNALLKYFTCVNASCVGYETVIGTNIGSAVAPYGQLYVSRVNLTGGLLIDNRDRNGYAIDVQGNAVGNQYLRFYDGEISVMTVTSDNFTYRNANDSAHAFQIQDSSGDTIFGVDTDGGKALVNGDIQFGVGSNRQIYVDDSPEGVDGYSLNITAGAAGGGSGPTDGGSLYLQAGGSFGDFGNGGDVAIISGSTNDSTRSSGSIAIQTGESQGASGDIYLITGNSATDEYGAIYISGSTTTFQNQIDSGTAFQIQNANSDVLFNVDTSGSAVSIGENTLFSLGSFDADPSGSAGAMYYNTSSDTFRCFQGGGWVDCIGAAGGSNILQGGNSFGADVTIGTNDNYNLNFETNGVTQATLTTGGDLQLQGSLVTAAVTSTSDLTLSGGTGGSGGTLTQGGTITLTQGSSSYPGGDVIITGGATSSSYSNTPGAEIMVQGAGYSTGSNIVLKLGNHYDSSAAYLQVTDSSGANILQQVSNTGATTFQNSSDSSAAFQIKNLSNDSLFTVNTSDNQLIAGANLMGNASATGTTATTSGTGGNTTTVTLTGSAFANGDVIFIDNAGQDYFTRITAGGGTASLTVSPAVTFENGRTVTKYNAQYLGSDGTNFSGATRNQNSFFQGYFTGGIVTGTGSTIYSDGNISSVGDFKAVSGGTITLQAGSGSCTIANTSGNLACTGTINGATLSGAATITGGSLSATAVNGLSVSGGTINNPTISGTVTGSGTPTITGFGTYNGQTIDTASIFQGTVAIQGANALTLGTSGGGGNTGAIVFRGSGGAGTLTLQGPTTPNAGNYTLSIPAITGNANICTDNSICSGYAAASPSGAYIQKNAQDTSSASTTGNLLGLTNTNTGAAGVLSLTNSGTNSALSILQSGTSNPSAGQALIFANNNVTTPSGNLIDLQNKGTSEFKVDVSGNSTQLGLATTVGLNAQSGLIQGALGLTVTGATVNLNASSNNNATNINTGSSTGNVSIGNSAAGAITLQSGSTIGLTSSTSTSIQTGASGAINIGTTSQTSTLTLGNTTGASTVYINSGTGGIIAGRTNDTEVFTITNSGNQTVFVANTSDQRIAIGPAAVTGNGVLTIGTNTTAASGGLYFGTDVNLYRGNNNLLQTDDALTIAGLLTGSLGATISGAAINLNTSGSSATNINTGSNTGAVTIGNSSNSANTLTLEAGTAANAIQIGNGATAHGIQIGTGAAVQTIVLGSTNTTSTTTIQGGSGSNAINIVSGIGTGAVASGGINITGGVASGSNGSTGGAISLAGGAGGVSRGNGGSITIQGGDAPGAAGGNGGSVTINGGFSGIGTLGAVNIGTTNTSTLTLGANGTVTTIRGGAGVGITLNPFGSGNNNGVLVKPTNDTTLAFQIQNSSSTALLTADTTNTRINVVGDVNVGTRFGDRLFSDNFESGELSFWTVSGADTSTATVHDGKYAARLNPSASDSYAETYFNPSTTVYARAWVNITSQTSSEADLLGFVNSDVTAAWTVYRNSGTIQLWNDCAGSWVGSGGALSTSAWHLIELRITTGAGSGVSQVWMDGNLVINATSQNNCSAPINRAVIGSGGSQTFVAYVDDLAVDVAPNGTASSLNVDDSFHVGGTGSFGNSLRVGGGLDVVGGTIYATGSAEQIITVQAAAGDIALTTRYNDGADVGLQINANGQLNWNNDTNLYRADNSVLVTDGDFFAGSEIGVQNDGLVSWGYNGFETSIQGAANGAGSYMQFQVNNSAILALGSSTVIVAPAADADDTLVVLNEDSDSVLQVATDGSTVLTVNQWGGGNLMQVTRATDQAMIIDNGGRTIFRTLSGSNSPTAFQVQSSTTTIFNVDTTNSRVGIGPGVTAPSYTLDVQSSQSSTYVARIYNTNTGTNADGLLISLGVGNTSRTTGNYFVGFSTGNGTVAGKIQGGNNVVAYTTNGADYAEYFLAANPADKPQAAEIVSLAPSDKAVHRAEQGTVPIVGVISESPGFLGNGPICDVDDQSCDNDYVQTNVIVGLNGQLPVKVTSEGGPIAPGDPITTGSIPGTGVKATGPAQIVGYAMESYSDNGVGIIKVYVNPGYYNGPNNMDYLQSGGNAVINNLTVNGTASFADLNVSGTATIDNLTVIGSATIGTLTVTGNAHIAGDIIVGGHVITSGGQPTSEAQTAVGAGANVAIDGTDTTGTITITTGTDPASGDLAKIIFSKVYGQAPRVVLSPSNDKAAGLRIYKGNTTATDFMFNALDNPVPNTTYKFDYFIAQ